MPIYEHNYRGWEGERTPASQRWRTIARSELGLILRRRAVRVTLLVAQLLPLSYIALILLQSGLLDPYLPWLKDAQGQLPAVDATLFSRFFAQQWLFSFLVALLAGSARVANDVRANAFLFYLSRPVEKVDYVLGKFSAVSGVLTLVGLLPATLLLVVAVLVRPQLPSPRVAVFDLDGRLVLAVLVTGVLTAAYYAAGVLLASAFARSVTGAAVRFAGLVFLSWQLYGVIGVMFRVRWAGLLSFVHNLEQVACWLLGVELELKSAPELSLFIVAAVIGAAVVVLTRRLRAVEVET